MCALTPHDIWYFCGDPLNLELNSNLSSSPQSAPAERQSDCKARVGFVRRNLPAAERDHKFLSTEALNAYLVKGAECINQLPFKKA